MVTLTSITTKLSDASKTIIYSDATTKPKHEAQFPSNPQKLLPHWHPLPKWAERLRRPI
jgi:hypothetical protein